MRSNPSEILIDRIAKQFKKDKRVTRYITSYLFSFIGNTFRDEKDYTPIMLRYLGKFIVRYNAVKKNRNDAQGKNTNGASSTKTSVNEGLGSNGHLQGENI